VTVGVRVRLGDGVCVNVTVWEAVLVQVREAVTLGVMPAVFVQLGVSVGGTAVCDGASVGEGEGVQVNDGVALAGTGDGVSEA
jgi:hypothetical protein